MYIENHNHNNHIDFLFLTYVFMLYYFTFSSCPRVYWYLKLNLLVVLILFVSNCIFFSTG
jgi:hypothetical protein